MERRKIAMERRRNVVVGVTALVGIAGLIVLLAAFGYVPALMRSGYEVTVYSDNVSGLRENSRVTLWGREIGEVKTVDFATPGAPGKTYVTLLIDKRYAVPEDVDVRVETPLFGGGPVVALVGGEPGGKALAMDGSAKLESARIIDPLMQLEVVSEDLSDLKDTWRDVGENVNTLFGAVDDEGTPSLPRVVVSLEDRLAQLERVFGGAEKWFTNEQLYEDVSKTAANARELSDTLEQSVASLEKRYTELADSAEKRLAKVDTTLQSAQGTLDQAGQSIAELEKNYVALTDDAANVIAVIDKLVKQAQTKDSTIGLLLSDPQLYQNLNDTAERLKLMTDDARLLIEKWKAEGVPIKVFN